MKSVAQKLEQCKGLLGTKDITAWEDRFLRDTIALINNSGRMGTAALTPKEIDKVEEIWGRHFV